MTTSTRSESAAKKDVTKLQRAIVDGLEDVKAQDIQVFDTEKLSPLFERVIVASGTSNRQTKALAASVRDAVREAGFPKPRTEGEDNGEWIIVDCGAAVAHIMQPAIRQYYRLEEIWGETPVRLKLGAPKPRIAEAEGSEPAKKKAAPRRKAAEAAPEVPARKPGRAKAAAAPAKKAAAPAKGAAAKSAAAKGAPARKAAAPVKAAAAKTAAGKTAAAKTAAKSPAAKTTPKIKTLVVKPAAKKVAAKKPAATRAPAKAAPAQAAAARKPAAKKAPARKKAP